MNSDATAEAALGLLGLTTAHIQPPAAIVPSKRKQSLVSSAPQVDDTSAESIKCICGFTYDDGFSIACDDCSKWCHAACFGIVEGGVPDEWRCWECVPRPVDKERAVKVQRARLKALQEQANGERPKRRASPGIERKHRRATTVGVEGSTQASKRKRRISILATPQQHTNHNSHNHNEDELVDIGDPWTHSYVPITNDIIPHRDTRDRLKRQAQQWRGVTALSPTTPIDPTPVTLPPESFLAPSPTAIQPLPPATFTHPTLSLNTNPSVRPPSYALHATSPIPSDHFIAPYTSTITPSATYLSDPLNAYAHIGLPKPFVHLIQPPFDVALDSRITGNQTRFARSGCRPNAVLRPVLCARHDQRDDTLSFGVFALRDIKAQEEVVLGWEWDDGNAVHSLPALIEAPDTFPCPYARRGNPSHRQIEHLRAQMSNIIHSLTSTFTTCACGAKAKDCALTQMAAFVDGDLDIRPGTPVDLGPLVGTQRGFKTREKVPLSGGMCGVVRCADESVTDDIDSRQRDPRQRSATMPESTSSNSDHAPSFENLHAPRPVKPLPQLRTGSQPPPPHSAPPLQLPPRPPEQPERHLYAMAVDAMAEDQMPPKMRKRWIHQTSDSLRDPHNMSSASPSGSVVSLGSAFSGDGGHSGRSDGDTLDDAMQIDDHRVIMPPPPMPASRDPTTVSSLSLTFSSRSPPAHSVGHPPSTSPSTSFAQLTLLSPLISGYKPFSPPPAEHPFETFQESPDSPDSQSTTSDIEDTDTHRQSLALVPDIREEEPPNQDADADSEPKVRFASPHSMDCIVGSPRAFVAPLQPPASPPAELPPAAEVSYSIPRKEPPQSPPPQSPPPQSPRASDCAKHDEMQVAPCEAPAEPSSPAVHPAPTSPQSSPQPTAAPKVKMSLKDFALRKKRQREEELAKQSEASSSSEIPLQGHHSSVVESHMQAHSDPEPSEPPRPVTPLLNVPVASLLAEAPVVAVPEPQVIATCRSGSPVVSPRGIKKEKDLSLGPPLLPHNQVTATRSRSPSPSVPNGKENDQRGAAPGISLRAKFELCERSLSMDSEVLAPTSVSNDGLNGSTTDAPDAPRAATLSPKPSTVTHSRRPSQEDGEITGGPNDTPPPQAPPVRPRPKQSAFVPRSHTPPTQPRSFQATPPSPIASSSSISRRPSQPPPPSYARAPSSQAGPSTSSSARPPPSGPRALRTGNHGGGLYATGFPARTPSGPTYLPRGPSADRDRMDWGDRTWQGASRPRGRGGGPSTWGR